jgi:hypothetical protein
VCDRWVSLITVCARLYVCVCVGANLCFSSHVFVSIFRRCLLGMHKVNAELGGLVCENSENACT